MKKIRFNDNWKFHNAIKGGAPVSVTLPHDAMQTEERIPGLKNGDATGYYPGGRYIYEKEFEFAEKDGKNVYLEFEGIYQHAEIFVNGEKAGARIYGYSDILLNISQLIKNGKNLIRVIADNSHTPNSRWYSGSGIYRDVYLYVGDSSYIKPYGVKLAAKSINPAVIEIKTDVVNASDCQVLTEFYLNGIKEAEYVGAKGTFTLENAKLWSAETPVLYDVKTSLIKEGVVLDTHKERFGIRTIKISHENGLQINGKTVKLRGGCVHHDHGPLGAASFYQAELRRARIMKEAGFNAVRYAHNPAAKSFLDACDEVGLYVMDEAFDMWTERKSDRDYGYYFEQEWEKDTVDMIRVAYNHPSVILYSIGNEVLDTGLPKGEAISKKMNACCHREDRYRPTILAFAPTLSAMASKGIGLNRTQVNTSDEVNPYECNKKSETSSASGSKLMNMLMTVGPLLMKIMESPKKVYQLLEKQYQLVDIVGINYGSRYYSLLMKKQPETVLCGSETFNSEIAKHWKYVMKHDYMIGEFTWVAWDYLGEAGIGVPRYPGMPTEFSFPYPCISSGSGCFDLTGHMDGQGAHVMSVWGQLKKPYIGVYNPKYFGEKVKYGRWRNTDAIDSWSWKGCEGEKCEIQVFSCGAKIELFLNGKSLGKKHLTNQKAVYRTTYKPGVLKAVAYDKHGNEMSESILKTAEGNSYITLKAENTVSIAEKKDVAYVDITITDHEKTVKFNEDCTVKVRVEGNGTLAAVGNGNPLYEGVYTKDTCPTYQGHALAIVRSDGCAGKIKVSVSSEGMEEQSIVINTV